MSKNGLRCGENGEKNSKPIRKAKHCNQCLRINESKSIFFGSTKRKWSQNDFIILPILLCSLIALATAAKKYTVLRVSVKNDSQLKFLQYQYLNTSRFDFWKEPSVVGQDAHVMLKEAQREEFLKELKELKLDYEVMIDDVEKMVKKRAAEKTKNSFRSYFHLHDAPFVPGGGGQRGRIDFNLGRYHSFAEVINFLNLLAITYPDRVRVQPIGTTHEGRQIPLIKIGTTRKDVVKHAIWIDGGIHAREWVSPATVIYFIYQLATEYDKQPVIRNLVDQFDWYIVPLLNPDGYEFSRSSPDPETRLWRKNRSPLQCAQRTTGLFSPPQTECCQGVDLNRNFDWYFGQVGSSTDPCSEIYAGTSAFSEPETQAIRDFIAKLQGRVKAFLTFHSYSQILMYPFGHAVRTYAQDGGELSTTARKAARALQSVYGTQYKVGTGADTLYPASGGSEDWAKGTQGIKFSYLFELRPEEHIQEGFLLPENQILPTARETFEAVKVIAGDILRQFPGSASNVAAPAPAANSFAGRLVCRDLDQLCSYWAQNNACPTWPSMRERCPASCGFC